jgi:hypothetical protein
VIVLVPSCLIRGYGNCHPPFQLHLSRSRSWQHLRLLARAACARSRLRRTEAVSRRTKVSNASLVSNARSSVGQLLATPSCRTIEHPDASTRFSTPKRPHFRVWNPSITMKLACSGLAHIHTPESSIVTTPHTRSMGRRAPLPPHTCTCGLQSRRMTHILDTHSETSDERVRVTRRSFAQIAPRAMP